MHIVGGEGIRVVRADKFYHEKGESHLHLVFMRCKDFLLNFQTMRHFSHVLNQKHIINCN